ncbi:hypothetical protein LCL95_17850 [Bacillus timonensis]|nr:hypothetical protein [Bacillus timonensis]
MKPNYIDLGFSNCMGPELRTKIEELLVKDLKQYGVKANMFKFDWSESCVEGKRTTYLDGDVEDFSGIKVFNEDDELLADGWMEFIHDKDKDFFISFWDFLSIYKYGRETEVKKEIGLPNHIIEKLPNSIRSNIDKYY